MTVNDVFSFDDVVDAARPRVTTPLPGVARSPRPANPIPGTLFARSPLPVASGVTRGVKKDETRVGLLFVKDPQDICGGVIGHPENKKFCVAHPSVCDYPTSHARNKVELSSNTFYVMSTKKGALHATLLPTLGERYLPPDVKITDLLTDDRPVAMWQVYFEDERLKKVFMLKIKKRKHSFIKRYFCLTFTCCWEI